MKNLELVKIKNACFGNNAAHIFVSGYALKNENGFLHFKGDTLECGIKKPYMPRGGRKSLQILLDGGFSSSEGIEFVKEFIIH